MKKIATLSFAAFALFISAGMSTSAMADGGNQVSPIGGGGNQVGKCQTCFRIGGAYQCFPIC